MFLDEIDLPDIHEKQVAWEQAHPDATEKQILANLAMLRAAMEES